MSKVYKYSRLKHIFLSFCPNKKNIKIGSSYCEECKYHELHNKEEQTVECSYEEGKNE